MIWKRDIVLNDKGVIENVIKTLDEQTKAALRNACEQVNKVSFSVLSPLLMYAYILRNWVTLLRLNVDTFQLIDIDGCINVFSSWFSSFIK